MLGMAKKKQAEGPGDEPKRVDRHVHPRYALHMPQEMLDALGAYCAAQRLVPDKSDVVRLAIKEFLEREGYWQEAKAKVEGSS